MKSEKERNHLTYCLFVASPLCLKGNWWWFMLINALQMGDGEHQRHLKHQMDASENASTFTCPCLGGTCVSRKCQHSPLIFFTLGFTSVAQTYRLLSSHFNFCISNHTVTATGVLWEDSVEQAGGVALFLEQANAINSRIMSKFRGWEGQA